MKILGYDKGEQVLYIEKKIKSFMENKQIFHLPTEIYLKR